MLFRQGERQRAAEVLLFSLGHEAMPPMYRLGARPTLDALGAELLPEELAAARDTAASAELEGLVTETLRDPEHEELELERTDVHRSGLGDGNLRNREVLDRKDGLVLIPE